MKEKTQETAIVPSALPTAELIPGQTAELIKKSFAENTIRNRRHALQKFDEWLQGKQITDGLLAEYITHLFDLGKAPGTISIAVSAVKWYLKHHNGGTPVELPITSATLSGIRNSAILRVMSDGLLRISEVTELRISDLEDNTLRLRFSKMDQEGSGEHLYLCEDTRQIVAEWLERSELGEGYLFRRMTARGDNLYRDKQSGEPSNLTDDGVRRIIKSCAARVGLTEKVSGHSLRIGTTVSLAQRGASLVDIQVAGRWKDPGMPAHYARAQFAEARRNRTGSKTGSDN